MENLNKWIGETRRLIAWNGPTSAVEKEFGLRLLAVLDAVEAAANTPGLTEKQQKSVVEEMLSAVQQAELSRGKFQD